MALLCALRDKRLSRYVDGELPLAEYRLVQEHLRACGRCARRVAALRALDALLAVDDDLDLPLPAAPGDRLAVSLAVAAALLCSLAANLWLSPPEPRRERGVITVPEPPSEALSGFYARLSARGPS